MTEIAFPVYPRQIANMPTSIFLEGVPKAHIIQRLSLAGGNELESGKLSSPQSSASLAINTFGRFCLEPDMLPPIETLAHIDWPANHVDVEYCARFTWAGGRHPWLDALIQTPNYHVGVECKRFEPYRDSKKAHFAETYWRDVWGDRMTPFLNMRDNLQSGSLTYKYLDAAQLVKHALGLRSDYARGKVGKPILLYVYLQSLHSSPVRVTKDDVKAHQVEIVDFGKSVQGSEVSFAAISYEEWLSSFPASLKTYADEVSMTFNLQI